MNYPNKNESDLIEYIETRELEYFKDETVADIILSYLRTENVRSIFGMQGGYTVGIGDKLNDYDDIRFIRCQHEEGAAFMADGYAKATGKFGAVLVTAGPSLTNTITGIISSYTDNVPIMLIAGAIPRKKAFWGAIQDVESYRISVVNMFREMTRFHANIFEPETFVQYFRNGVRHLHRGTKGPIFFNIASDVFSQKVHHNYEFVGHGDNLFFEAEAVKHALKILKKTKKAVIFAGNGVKQSGAQNELEKLVKIIKIPVITTPKGKSAFNNESPYYLGSFGAGTHPVVEKFLEEEDIDTVIAFGTSFSEYSGNAWSGYLKKAKTLIQVDLDPHILGRSFANTLGINGDCAATMRYMKRKVLEELEAYEHLNSEESINNYKNKYPLYENIELYYSDETPIKVPRLMKDIFESFYQFDVNIFNDNGSCIFWVNHYLELKRGWNFFSSLGFSSMGYAIPAAIGGACGRPDRVTIAITGDGSAIMNGNEIKTAAEYNIPLFIFILNDAKLGIVYHSTNMICGRPNAGTEFNEPIDFVKYAESLGVEAYVIDSPGQINPEFINNLVNRQKPIVFDCRISPTELGPYESRIKQVQK